MSNEESVESVMGRVKSQTILTTANKIINGQRNDEYGPAERSFQIIADMWNAYMSGLDRDFFMPHDVAMMMILLKVARTQDVPTTDSLVDICGYAALASECLD